MTNGKVILFFNNGVHGWSESYYTPASGLDQLFLSANALVSKRMELLCFPAALQAIRVSDADEPRVSQLTPRNLSNPVTKFSSNADEADVAAMMRLYSPAQARSRALYLRGNPDNVFNTAQPTNLDLQAWTNAYNFLGQFLANTGPSAAGPWSIKFKPPSSTGQVDIISFLSANKPEHSTITVAPGAAIGLSAGDFITLYKMKGLDRTPGLCKVVSVDTTGAEVVIQYRYQVGFSYQGAAYFVDYTAGYDAIDSFSAPRFTRRATGRPSDVSRGRRRSIPK